MARTLKRRELIKKATTAVLFTVSAFTVVLQAQGCQATRSPNQNPGKNPTKNPAKNPGGNPKCSALLIASGTFDDKSITRLEGVEQDITMMRDLLHYKYGFEQKDIRVLGVRDATRDNILKAIQHLVEQMDENTYAVLYYSGHGGQVLDPQRKSDHGVGTSEYIIARDDAPVFDFEIDHLTNVQRGHLTLIFDCCHASGMARSQGVNVNVFGIEKRADLPESTLNRWLKSGLKREGEFISSKDAYRSLLAATSKRDVAMQIRVPSPDQSQPSLCAGAFTYALYNVVMRSAVPLTNGAIFAQTSNVLRTLLKENDRGRLNVVNGKDGDLAIAPASTFIATVPTLASERGRVLPVGWMCQLRLNQPFKAQNGKYVKVSELKPFASTLSDALPSVDLDPKAGAEFTPMGKVPKGAPPAENTEGVHLEIVPDKRSNGGYVVFGDTLTGRYNLGNAPTKAVADQIVSDQKRALGTASSIVDSLNGSLSAQSLSFGIQMSIRAGNAEPDQNQNPIGFPRLRELDEFDLQILSQKPAYLLLLSCEPDGSINILYPNQETKSVFLKGQELLHLVATRPLGITTLVAIESTTEFTLPSALLKRAQYPMTHYSILPARMPAFLDWMQATFSQKSGSLPRGLAEEMGRGTGTPAGARVLSLGTIEVSRFSFVTEAANPLPELVKATAPDLTSEQRRELEARPIQLQITVETNGNHIDHLTKGTGAPAIDEAIRESLNHWIWRPGVRIDAKTGQPAKKTDRVNVIYNYSDGSYEIRLLSAD